MHQELPTSSINPTARGSWSELMNGGRKRARLAVTEKGRSASVYTVSAVIHVMRGNQVWVCAVEHEGYLLMNSPQYLTILCTECGRRIKEVCTRANHLRMYMSTAAELKASGRCTFTATNWPVRRTRALYTWTEGEELRSIVGLTL